MRHIPEDELHPYLDQALSRSQCVEIECHLATCSRCRTERDAIAALRDRTTALLGRLGPRILTPPPFKELQAQFVERERQAQATRLRRVKFGHGAIRAAGVAAAALIGWSAHSVFDRKNAAPNAVPTQVVASTTASALNVPKLSPPATIPPEVAPQPSVQLGQSTTRPTQPWRREPTVAWTSRNQPETPNSPVQLQVASAQDAVGATDFDAPGLWRTVSWDEADALTGGLMPRIQGLPVIEVQVQKVSSEERPLVMVAQQDGAGKIVRTIEGPVARVAELLSREVARAGEGLNSSQPARSPSDYVSAGPGQKLSTRVFVVAGRLAADSLETLSESVQIKLP